jgi:hypothetical protein
MHSPLENANQVLAKIGLTMNRGGSTRGNPILSGLGVRTEYALGIDDILTAVYLYQDRTNLGLNLRSQVLAAAPGILALEFLAGAGTTVAGSPVTGARRNFIRWDSKRGAVEREFWIKSKDPDIVTVGGFSALDPTTLLPVFRQFSIIGGGPWLTIPVDFMPSWNDEFLALHRDGNPEIEPGFAKAYGGAKFVSFFDEVPGTEGVGTAVEPITDAEISTLRQINVQNTPGQKKLTARFRSKAGSVYFVDSPVWIEVLGAPTVICNSPHNYTEVKEEFFTKCGDPPPPDCPGVPGTPVGEGDPHGPPPVVWPGGPVPQPLVIVGIHGASVGTPRLVVRKWKLEASAGDPQGAKLTQVGADEFYTTLQAASGEAPLGGPYAAPVRHRIALDYDADKAADVAYYEVWLDDDTLGSPLRKRSAPILVAGPKARDIGGFPTEQGS